MELKLYLKHIRRCSLGEFCREHGFSYDSMSGYQRKIHKPRLSTARRIEKATNGRVTAYEMITGEYNPYSIRYEVVKAKKEDDGNPSVEL